MDFRIAQDFDKQDELAHLRKCFNLPKSDPDHTAIYLCGNSLGPQPAMTKEDLEKMMDKWQNEGVLGWFGGRQPFAQADDAVTEDLATVVGAFATEVVAMNSLTVNLHLMLATFYKPTSERFKIIVEESAFPSTVHALESHISLVHNRDPKDVLLKIPRREGEDTWQMDDILDFIHKHAAETALIFMSGVHYSTGQLFDIAKITKVGHDGGCFVGWDLAHAVGNVVLELHDWSVDFAVWCSYKYLNAGPGAVGGCFINSKHDNNDTQKFLPRLAGWWGQREEDRFSFDEACFVPAHGAMGFRLSTPSPLMLSTLKSSLNVFKEAGGMKALRNKSMLLTEYLEKLLDEVLPNHVRIITPRKSHERGCQLSFTFNTTCDTEEGCYCIYAENVLAELEEKGFIADVRKPNIMRVAPMPLYTRFIDVFRFVFALQEILIPSPHRKKQESDSSTSTTEGEDEEDEVVGGEKDKKKEEVEEEEEEGGGEKKKKKEKEEEGEKKKGKEEEGEEEEEEEEEEEVGGGKEKRKKEEEGEKEKDKKKGKGEEGGEKGKENEGEEEEEGGEEAEGEEKKEKKGEEEGDKEKEKGGVTGTLDSFLNFK